MLLVSLTIAIVIEAKSKENQCIQIPKAENNTQVIQHVKCNNQILPNLHGPDKSIDIITVTNTQKTNVIDKI